MNKTEIEVIKEKYSSLIPLLQEISKELEIEVKKSLDGLPNIDRISFRVKTLERFIEKVEKKKYINPLVNIEDQIGGRVVVFFLDDMDIVKDRLERTFHSIEDRMVEKPEDDVTHISRDDSFGYQSFHYIFSFPPQIKSKFMKSIDEFPQTFEIQIRTIFMHAYAEPQHDINYEKPEDLPKEVRKGLAWIAASAWGADKEYQRIINRKRTNGSKSIIKK